MAEHQKEFSHTYDIVTSIGPSQQTELDRLQEAIALLPDEAARELLMILCDRCKVKMLTIEVGGSRDAAYSPHDPSGWMNDADFINRVRAGEPGLEVFQQVLLEWMYSGRLPH